VELIRRKLWIVNGGGGLYNEAIQQGDISRGKFIEEKRKIERKGG